MALEPITRQEKIISGENLKPITRMERFLKEFGGGSGGGVSPEEVTTIVKEQFPGGVGYEEVQTVNEPLNIAWDGNTEGLVSVGDMFFKVSDAVLTDEQIKSATIVVGGEQISIANAWDDAPSSNLTDEIAMPCEFVAFVREAGADFKGAMEFPECGIYFINMEGMYPTSLTTTEPIEQTKVVTKPISAEYLPNVADIPETWIADLKAALGI